MSASLWVALAAVAAIGAQEPRPFLRPSQGADPVAQTPDLVRRFREGGALQLLDAFVARQMQQDRTPAVALAITSRDALLMQSTYGFADLRARVPLTPAHLFEIGSISKSFTAIALLQQRDAGRFDPNAPIKTYLPWFSVKSTPQPITGHHLLTHTAGIPRDRDDIPSSLYQAAALQERVTGSVPGTRYAYSNIGYQVLGYALAAIAGHAYPDVIRDGIFRPLGMTSSDAQFTHETRLRLAVGYDEMYDDRPPHVSHPLVPATWLEYAAGDGSVVSNGDDMAAYLRMLLNRGRGPGGALISPASFELLAQKTVKTGEAQWYGYGMTVREVAGHTMLAHSGGMVGYTSTLLADLTDGIGVIVLMNGPGAGRAIADFGLTAARAVMKGDELPPLPALDQPLRVPNAADYDGTYTSSTGIILKVVGDADRLWLVHRGERLALEGRGTDRFYVNHPDYSLFLLQFFRDPTTRQVTEAAYGDVWFAGQRYQGPRAFTPPAAWSAYPGHYRTTHAWFSNFRILLRKGELRLSTPEGTEQRLIPLSGQEFALDDKDSAERISFDTIIDGAALRATLSGVHYYRSFTP